MAQQQSYLLRIWRSRAPSGRQWAAQVLHLGDVQDRRFTDPEAFCSYLRALTSDAEPVGPQPAVEQDGISSGGPHAGADRPEALDNS